MQLVVISGLSGSGKSIALNVLEDNGYYCVDNLPAALLPDFVRLLDDSGVTQAAASMDVRGVDSLERLPTQIDELKARGVDVRLLFLEANHETLVKRFSETRRRHPLNQGERSIAESIRLERELLGPIAPLGHRLDSSELRPNALRAWVKDIVALDRSRLTLVFESFGFKHGIPLDADLVFDVRCLPNPHYDPRLRPLTGNDADVIQFLDADADVQDMFEDIAQFVEKWLPRFLRDFRSYLTVAIGCTGGQHRSVYLVEKLADRFRARQQVLVRHRELA